MDRTVQDLRTCADKKKEQQPKCDGLKQEGKIKTEQQIVELEMEKMEALFPVSFSTRFFFVAPLYPHLSC